MIEKTLNVQKELRGRIDSSMIKLVLDRAGYHVSDKASSIEGYKYRGNNRFHLIVEKTQLGEVKYFSKVSIHLDVGMEGVGTKNLHLSRRVSKHKDAALNIELSRIFGILNKALEEARTRVKKEELKIEVKL